MVVVVVEEINNTVLGNTATGNVECRGCRPRLSQQNIDHGRGLRHRRNH